MKGPVLIERWPSPGALRPVHAGALIGRERTEVQMADPRVSRRHALFVVRGGRLAIEDLGSLHGTYVNGHRIHEATPLADGDELRLGLTVYTLRLP